VGRWRLISAPTTGHGVELYSLVVMVLGFRCTFDGAGGLKTDELHVVHEQ
jgi:hypothetical protein